MRWTRFRPTALTLTQRLAGLSALTIVPAAAALLYSTVTIHQQRHEEAAEVALRVGELVSLEMERIVSGIEGTLQALAHAPVVRNFNRQACEEYLKGVHAQLSSVIGFAVADREGVLRCGTTMPAGRVEIAERPYFRQALKSDGLVVGEFTRSKVSGNQSLPLAVPIKRDGETTGVVLTGLNLDWLGERLRERRFFTNSAITIADRDGMIIAREPLPERFIGTRIPEDFMRLVRAEEPGSLTVRSQDGTRRILGYYPPAATGSGLYVSAGISTEAISAPIYSSTYRSLGIAAGGALTTFGVAWLMGDRLIRRPIARIMATVEAWKAGDTAARTGIARSRSELDTLASAIDGYMDALAADRAARRAAEAHRALLVGELEHRVKNMLAVISAIASQTFKNSATQESQSVFRQRLSAMAETHALLSSGNWTTADLRKTLVTALTPFGEPSGGRVSLEGPPVQVTSRAALAISMAVHELSTNAVKYGALANDKGTVSVSWGVRQAPEGARFTFAWLERGGPTVGAPGPAGFGSRMIRSVVGQELSAETEFSLNPEGAVFRLDAPTAAVLGDEGLDAEHAA